MGKIGVTVPPGDMHTDKNTIGIVVQCRDGSRQHDMTGTAAARILGPHTVAYSGRAGCEVPHVRITIAHQSSTPAHRHGQACNNHRTDGLQRHGILACTLAGALARAFAMLVAAIHAVNNSERARKE